MHPRNRHAGRYDFPRLIQRLPQLEKFLRPSPSGDPTIDFADPAAVLALNRALLAEFYEIAHWSVPSSYLCPPIPGRADYIHHLADLLADQQGNIPRGDSVHVLDIGTGANCIYPIIGRHDYGWRFVGSDIDAVALKSAGDIAATNPALRGGVELRLQPSPSRIFHGVVRAGERFAACVCNPPFHASAAAAQAATGRKIKNLSGGTRPARLVQNFGGQSHELWCAGGEAAFVRRMISESMEFRDAFTWFTTLVSKRESLPLVEHALAHARVAETRIIPMAQGQKKSRIVAWRF